MFNSHTFDDDNNDVAELPPFVGFPERIENLLKFVSSHKSRPVSCGMKQELLDGSLVYLRVVGMISLGEDYFDEPEDIVPLSAVYICENTFETIEKHLKGFEEAFCCPVKAVFVVLVPQEDAAHINELGAVLPTQYASNMDVIDIANMAAQCLKRHVKCHIVDCEQIADRYGADIFFAAPEDTSDELVTAVDEPTLFGMSLVGCGIRLYIDDMAPGVFQVANLLDDYQEEEE